MTARAVMAACLALVLLGPGRAAAVELPPDPGPQRTAKMFELFCFNQLPDIAAIAKIAKAGEFTELKGDELKTYSPDEAPAELRAWHYNDFGGKYVLTISRTVPGDQFKAEFPAYADSMNFACSLVTPARDPKDEVLAEMKKMLGRDPDDSWEKTPLRIHSWTGGNDKLLVHVYHYGMLKGPATVLMSATTFVKQ